MNCITLLNSIIKDKYSFEELNTSCGVYIISLNDKHYIGSCKMLNYNTSRNGFCYRLYTHLYNLLKGTHHSLKLQNAVNKYGICNIEFDIIHECDSSLTVGIEQYWINIMDTYKKGYNSCPTASSNFGYKHTSIAKLKISESKKGKSSWNKGLKLPSPSEETKLRISLAGKGRTMGPMSEEQKKKISNTLKGTTLTKEQRLNYLKAKENQKGINHWAAKKAYQYSIEGDFIKVWNYVKETENFGFKTKQVYSCLAGTQKSGSGYRWFYTFQGKKIEPLISQKNQYLLTLK
jgi:group I intron endonuclease